MKVSADKPLLYHYTTAQGLMGIVESQQLFATSIAFLNDAEEHFGYLTHRLPVLLECWVRGGLGASPRKEGEWVQSEFEAKIREVTARLHQAIIELTARYDDPYVTSFSAPPTANPEDGLLSQWRGYGRDGGYAIVFETIGIERLLALEGTAFHHQALMICDVDYHSYTEAKNATCLPETTEDEMLMEEGLKCFLKSGEQGDLESIYQPLMQLSVRSKHRGFKEESEVRIVALRSVGEVWTEERRGGEARSQRDLFFKCQNGLTIPYVKLFGKDKFGSEAVLPIKQVIVGPHPEKTKRRKAVERFLEQHQIDATVTETSIPYVGS